MGIQFTKHNAGLFVYKYSQTGQMYLAVMTIFCHMFQVIVLLLYVLLESPVIISMLYNILGIYRESYVIHSISKLHE